MLKLSSVRMDLQKHCVWLRLAGVQQRRVSEEACLADVVRKLWAAD